MSDEINEKLLAAKMRWAKAARITGRGTVDNSLPQLVMDEDEVFAGLLAAMG